MAEEPKTLLKQQLCLNTTTTQIISAQTLFLKDDRLIER